MKLVLVHGRDQQGKKQEALKKLWLSALKEGLDAQQLPSPDPKDVSFPYYGDALDKRVKQLDVPVGNEIKTRGGNIDPEYQQFRGELIEEIRRKAKISDAEVEREFPGALHTKGPMNWEWVQAILRALDRNVPSIGSAAIERFTRDVYVYLKFDDVRDAVNKIVADGITTERTVVVGHSLGSVVAYDALRKDKRKIDVILYLTVGSPLGVEQIRTALRPIKFPRPGVKAWYNAYDTRDVVALYPLDNGNFDVSPDKIEGFSDVENQTDNRHGIVGYLNNKTIAKRIHDAMKS